MLNIVKTTIFSIFGLFVPLKYVSSFCKPHYK